MMLLLFINNVSLLNQYDSSEPVYFVNAEAKRTCEEIMNDTYDHMLNSGETCFRGE